LSDVQAFTTNRLGKSVLRHLSFAFNRTIEGGAVKHLLVTVQDITTRKELEAALHAHKHGTQKDISMMLKALETDSGQLADFVTRSEKELLQVNLELRELSVSGTQRESHIAIESVFRRMHAFKGEAQVLGLDVLSLEAHAMETLLTQLRSEQTPSQDVLLQLPIHLESLLSKLSVFRDMSSRRQTSANVSFAATQALSSTSATAAPIAPAAPHFSTQLTMLANDVARDEGKSVETRIALDALVSFPNQVQQTLKDICIQLVRNAVVHGIEKPSARIISNKRAAGQISVRLMYQEDAWLLIVRDDGAGLSAPRIRQRLAQLAWYNEEQLAAMDDKLVISHIFKPGFSTAVAVDQAAGAWASMHAGRGVGLDVVQVKAKSIGAGLGLGSQPGQYTEFRLKFHGAAP
jgi:chemotaxis protein histidine kinase CheA